MHPMLNIAIRAARRAGDVILRGLEQRHHLHVEMKGHSDFVTEIDRQAEAMIIDTLLSAYPHHGILAEESGKKNGKEPFVWVIDPLDGTTNYLHGHPQFAVSIALKHKDRLEQAVVYNPLTEELFTASRGQGALLNNKRIRVSNTTQLQTALLGTGFPFYQAPWVDTYIEIFRDLILKTSGMRRCGSAALDLAYVAAGRLDGFWEFGLKPWDISAGTLLVLEAGGLVSDMHGNNEFLEKGDLVAGNLKIHKQLLEIVKPYLK